MGRNVVDSTVTQSQTERPLKVRLKKALMRKPCTLFDGVERSTVWRLGEEK